MDAFDFFVVVFLVDTLAERFGVTKKDIIWTITATLAMRPIGAVIFGLLADRYGRRIPLMVNLVFFSIVEVLCGFAPNYATFLVLRALFGIGMGGEWGVGASLAMESAPRKWRGMLSGILQSGYSIGYLLAAVAARLVLPTWGWRAMFWVGGLPALLAFYIRWHVPESEAWKQHRAPTIAAIGKTVRQFVPRLVYLVALMTMMMFLSHGTQDLYPDFLKIAHGIPAKTVALVAILYNVGAVLGAIGFGHASERVGRRYSMVAALPSRLCEQCTTNTLTCHRLVFANLDVRESRRPELIKQRKRRHAPVVVYLAEGFVLRVQFLLETEVQLVITILVGLFVAHHFKVSRHPG